MAISKGASNTARPRIGLALGSGGARGWCHIGVLRALKEAGIEPDYIAGCSMGAFVGAAYLTGDLEQLERWARTVNWRTIASFLDVNLVRGGLIDGARIPTILQSAQRDTRIESLPRPFTAIASDLDSGREIWLQTGSLLDAVRASISIPGIFSPVRIDDKWLLDGGMTNPVPVSACRAMGAEVIIAVNPNGSQLRPIRQGRQRTVPGSPADTQGGANLDRLLGQFPDHIRESLKSLTPDFIASRDDTPSYFEVLSTAITIMTDQIMRSRLAGEPPHILINPQLNGLAVLEFHRASEAIEEGRRATVHQLPLLKELLG